MNTKQSFLSSLSSEARAAVLSAAEYAPEVCEGHDTSTGSSARHDYTSSTSISAAPLTPKAKAFPHETQHVSPLGSNAATRQNVVFSQNTPADATRLPAAELEKQSSAEDLLKLQVSDLVSSLEMLVAEHEQALKMIDNKEAQISSLRVEGDRTKEQVKVLLAACTTQNAGVLPAAVQDLLAQPTATSASQVSFLDSSTSATFARGTGKTASRMNTLEAQLRRLELENKKLTLALAEERQENQRLRHNLADSARSLTKARLQVNVTTKAAKHKENSLQGEIRQLNKASREQAAWTALLERHALKSAATNSSIRELNSSQQERP